MAYEIPYDSDYQYWYGTPQNVTRLSAVLEQTLDENGNPVGLITASWDMPDNGGTFVAQVSTDGENYTIEETNIRQNGVVLTVLPNTDYYLKIVTVLDTNQSEGTVSDLLIATDIPTPNTPVVTVAPSGFRIDVGIIPQGYTAKISIDDGTTVDYVETSYLEYMYLCDVGEYDISVAFMDVNGNIGTYSNSVTVSIAELAEKDYVDNNFVGKEDEDYIKSASVNQSGDTLTLTKGNDDTITFQGGGYNLPIASASTLGGIKVGNNLSIDSNGVLSATGGGGDIDNTITYNSHNAVTSKAIYKALHNLDVYRLATVVSGTDFFCDESYIRDTAEQIIYTGVAGGSTHNITKDNDAKGIFGAFKTKAYNASRYDWTAIVGVSFDESALALKHNGSAIGVLASGTFFDTVRGCNWYYIVGKAESHPNTSGGLPYFFDQEYNNVQLMPQILLDAASPMIDAITIKEDLFNPTNCTITSGSTVTDDTLKTLINGYRPIKINGETYYFIKLDNGTYYYRNLYNIITVDSSWVMTITEDGGGYVLPIASANDLGGVKVGSGLSIDANGVLSATGGGGGSTFAQRQIYSGNWTSGQITLSESIQNFDDLVLILNNGSRNDLAWAVTDIMMVDIIKNSTSSAPVAYYGEGTRKFSFYYVSDTKLGLESRDTYGIKRIYGRKY